MQRINFSLVLVLGLLMTMVSSCEAIGGIFKAGIWTGLILVAIVIAIVIFIISKFRK